MLSVQLLIITGHPNEYDNIRTTKNAEYFSITHIGIKQREGIIMKYVTKEELQNAIMEHAEHFDMELYYSSGDMEQHYPKLDCGTTMCIAGFAVLLGGLAIKSLAPLFPQKEGPASWDYAANLILLQNDDFRDVYMDDLWPKDLRREYMAASAIKDRKAMAEVACKAIDYFWKEPV